jgi:hypothetical protein
VSRIRFGYARSEGNGSEPKRGSVGSLFILSRAWSGTRRYRVSVLTRFWPLDGTRETLCPLKTCFNTRIGDS